MRFLVRPSTRRAAVPKMTRISIAPHFSDETMSDLSHFDEHGASRMVDVGEKPVSSRRARAEARVRMAATTLQRIRDRNADKGDVLEVARLAGIMAAKRTADLIPLCHPLPLDSVTVNFQFLNEMTLGIEAETQVAAKTGVEMEALTAAAVAALTVYDMCKAVDREMTIETIRLLEKSGGRSGHYRRDAAELQSSPFPESQLRDH